MEIGVSYPCNAVCFCAGGPTVERECQGQHDLQLWSALLLLSPPQWLLYLCRKRKVITTSYLPILHKPHPMLMTENKYVHKYVAAGIWMAFDSALVLNTCKLEVHTQIIIH